MRTLLILAVLSGVSGGGTGTLSQMLFPAAQQDVKRIIVEALRTHEANQKVVLEKLEFRIRRDMPPEPTKKRIRAIEKCLEKNCATQATYEPPTYRWN